MGSEGACVLSPWQIFRLSGLPDRLAFVPFSSRHGRSCGKGAYPAQASMAHMVFMPQIIAAITVKCLFNTTIWWIGAESGQTLCADDTQHASDAC